MSKILWLDDFRFSWWHVIIFTESYGQNETKPEEELPEPDDDVIIDVELNPVGPNATHYNPETSLFITVQCSTDEDRVPCGSASISKWAATTTKLKYFL